MVNSLPLYSNLYIVCVIIKTAANSTFVKLKMAFSLVLKLSCEVAIFNFTNLQTRSIPLLIIYPLHHRLVFGSCFQPFDFGTDVVTVHFGYAYAHGFGFKFAPLISVGVWSCHFFTLLRCDVAAQVSVAVVKITSRIDAIVN